MNHKFFLNQLSRQKGFMITEVLITVLLIVITMMAVMPMISVGVKSSKISKNRAIEMNIAQKEIEGFNQNKFVNVLTEIENKIKNDEISLNPTDPARAETDAIIKIHNFKNGGAYKIAEQVCVNAATGATVTNLSLSDSCQKSHGFQSILITKNYSFSSGQATQVDDAIQLTVSTQLRGAQGVKPVTITTLLSRDKLQ